MDASVVFSFGKEIFGINTIINRVDIIGAYPYGCSIFGFCVGHRSEKDTLKRLFCKSCCRYFNIVSTIVRNGWIVTNL